MSKKQSHDIIIEYGLIHRLANASQPEGHAVYLILKYRSKKSKGHGGEFLGNRGSAAVLEWGSGASFGRQGNFIPNGEGGYVYGNLRMRVTIYGMGSSRFFPHWLGSLREARVTVGEIGNLLSKITLPETTVLVTRIDNPARSE